MHLTLFLGAALVLAAGAGDRAGAGEERPAPRPIQAPPQGTEEPPSIELDPRSAPAPEAVRAAVERALDWLAATQAAQPDGSLPPAGASQYAPLATTALGALAYMAAGSTPGRGPHHAELEAAIDYLLARVDVSPESLQQGFIADENRDSISRMHGHGFASLALAEAYTMSPHSARGARLAAALELAIRRTEQSQGVEGGWFYEPVRGIQHEGSVTIALVQGLRAAKDAGLRVDPEVIAKAVDYVRRSQKEDGSFRYQLGDERTSVALTAAAITTLHATGEYAGTPITQAYDYIERELAARAQGMGTPQGPMFRPLYERLYLAQAFWRHPDRNAFERWYAETARELIATQTDGGSWKHEQYGDCYSTSMNVLVLTIPDGLLPIFQR